MAALEKVEIDLPPEPSKFQGENRPVEQVSWYEAVEFCKRLSNHTGWSYGLPSEAEWEYACRAGTETPFNFGEKITTEVVNYHNNESRREYWKETTPVDYFGVANAFGLCDMHGNVVEWCQDHWHENHYQAPLDGSAWLTEDNNNATRVVRGGSWVDDLKYCRSAARSYYRPGSRDGTIGFRVACHAL